MLSARNEMHWDVGGVDVWTGDPEQVLVERKREDLVLDDHQNVREAIDEESQLEMCWLIKSFQENDSLTEANTQ